MIFLYFGTIVSKIKFFYESSCFSRMSRIRIVFRLVLCFSHILQRVRIIWAIKNWFVVFGFIIQISPSQRQI
jgi:hypothetical protein